MLQITAFYTVQCANGLQVQQVHLKNINPDECKSQAKATVKTAILRYKFCYYND